MTPATKLNEYVLFFGFVCNVGPMESSVLSLVKIALFCSLVLDLRVLHV